MKPVEEQITFRITYSMTLAEADLIFRMCDGYVALARELVKITARFPEKQEVLQQRLFDLAEGMGKEIQRAKQAQAVFEGKLVTITAERLAFLEEAVRLIEKPTRIGPDDHLRDMVRETENTETNKTEKED